MNRYIPLGDYAAITARTREFLARKSTLPRPFAGASSLQVYKDVVEDGRALLPARYHQPYVDVLDQAVKQAETLLATLGPRAHVKRKAIFDQLESVFSVLAAPIVQLRSAGDKEDIRAFISVVSNIYRRFMDDSKIEGMAKTAFPWPELDPLAFFGPGGGGPYTLAPTAELPLAIVCKPQDQRGCLPMWLPDGHEVGGHVIHTAVSGLEKELSQTLEAAIKLAFEEGRIKAGSVNMPRTTSLIRRSGVTTISLEDFMLKVWKAWAHETFSDVAGVLNMGPMFANALIIFLAVQRTTGGINPVSEYDKRSGFSDHPTDLVRVLLAIEVVKKLDFPDAANYANALLQRLKQAHKGALPQTIGWVDSSGAKVIEIPLSEMEAILPVVAEAMLNTPLESLSNRCPSSIVRWTKRDEELVRATVSPLIRASKQIDDAAEARHVIAASLLAFEKLATGRLDFDKLTENVHGTGISVLSDMYDQQCLLCAVPTYKKAASSISLSDLARTAKKMKLRAK